MNNKPITIYHSFEEYWKENKITYPVGALELAFNGKPIMANVADQSLQPDKEFRNILTLEKRRSQKTLDIP